MGLASLAGALVVALMSASIAAAKQAPPGTVTCGEQVTQSVTLTADVGPCPYTADGIDIVANNITINLNGHSITGTNSTDADVPEPVGINLLGVTGVTVEGPGVVQDFDAGIAINGGSNNTITGVTAQNNVAHVLETGGIAGDPNIVDTPCDYGDGILTDNSNYDTIESNTVQGNGPFDGIALVDASSYNTVTGNVATNNAVPNIVVSTAPQHAGSAGPCGPFGANIVGLGRPHQDIGIRIEGPGATHNTVSDNTADSDMLYGISIHGNVCPNNPAGVPAGAPNIDNTVIHNTTDFNGFFDDTDGIGVLTQGPGGIVCVAYDNSIISNTSSYNDEDGINIGGRGSTGNMIRGNTTDNNGYDGIELAGPSGGATGPLPGTINSTVRNNVAMGNGNFDGQDDNGNCTTNVWRNNKFGTFDPSCIA